ncbi:MAG: aspartate 1-decarboxylase [candidate division Zixibacteria bacterium]|nr:aspartate 1-decarboxylase [candidate division Zixibacteria bacterium]
MFITVMKSKIHRAAITGAELNYDGSISIDKKLMETAGIYPHEKVQVVNLNNGNRLETYVIEAKPDSGEICLNGPAARLGIKGDIIIIISYCHLHPEEIADHKPIIIKVDEKNRPA